ncbi:MAG: electron transfer flavoprotein subunit beta/FixA family protein [Deltaproteobacteria bacterium]|nr:electron transfer flavoprotein subunit beta/FixA family protein [Deltaproteobacteria bacterium]
MKILVSAKRVSDPNAKLAISSDGTWIEGDVEYVMNYFCENAIECALQLAEEHGDIETVALGIGESDETARFIRQGALARGIDRGILVSADEQTTDSDLIARIYARVAEREAPDLILIGKQAVDGDSNQVGQLLAEYLGWPQATFASKVELKDGEVVVTREVDGGLETLAVTLPAVVTADLRLNEPRFAPLAGIMKAKKKPLDELELDDLELGDAKPKVRIVKMSTPEGRKAGVLVKDVDDLVARLRAEARVL